MYVKHYSTDFLEFKVVGLLPLYMLKGLHKKIPVDDIFSELILKQSAAFIKIFGMQKDDGHNFLKCF